MQAVFNLSLLSTLRGDDSSGLFFISRKKDKVEPLLYKDVSVGPVLFNSVVSNGKLISKPGNTISVVMGHTRAATLGAINKATAHPFSFKNIVGCHNGTCHFMVPSDLTKEQKETQLASDSYNIFRLLQDEGLDATLDRVKDGAYALTWWDNRDNKLYFIRNDKRPLSFASNGGTMYWASERPFLEMIKERNRFNGLNIREAQPYVLYSLSAGSQSIILNEENKESVAKPKPRVSVFHGGMYGGSTDWEEYVANNYESPSKPDPDKPRLLGFLPPVPEVRGSPYERIRTNPIVNHVDKIFDYFNCTNAKGTIVSEPCASEVDNILKDGCCICGTIHTHVHAPRLAFFAAQDEYFSTYFYICDECLANDPKAFYADNETEALEMVPVYRPDE